MRFIPVTLLLLSSFAYGASEKSLILGHWICEPFTVEGEDGQVLFDITQIIEYKEDGTSTETQTYKMRGFEDQVWLKVKHFGPWKVQGTVLTEETYTTEIVEASMPDLKDSKEILQEMSTLGVTFVSDIIELSNSKLTTKNREIDEISTCVKV